MKYNTNLILSFLPNLFALSLISSFVLSSLNSEISSLDNANNFDNISITKEIKVEYTINGS